MPGGGGHTKSQRNPAQKIKSFVADNGFSGLRDKVITELLNEEVWQRKFPWEEIKV